MPKKSKSTEEHLKTIELMLAGVLLNQESKPELRKLAKLIGVSDDAITDLYPQRKGKKRNKPTEGATNE